jgi:hypothetical protein
MKTTKTYSIDEAIYNAFDSLTSQKNINKSSFIEECIKKFLKENDIDFIDKLYVLKDDPTTVVTVISQDSTYYFLDNGSKIQKILFMQIFKEHEYVDPNSFFSKSDNVLKDLGDKIKQIDVSKVGSFDSRWAQKEKQRKVLKSIKEKFDLGLYKNNSDKTQGHYINDIKNDLMELIQMDFSPNDPSELQDWKLKGTLIDNLKVFLI